MPVLVDKIDAEIEIVPSGDGGRSRAPQGAPGGGVPAQRIDLRRAVARSLHEQLDEYLRIRG